MIHRTTNSDWTTEYQRALAIAASVVMITSCAPKAGSRQSAMMRQTRMQVSADELRTRVYNLANRLTGLTENAADRIREEATDPGVRRRALLWKMEAIPAYHMAAFRGDPLAAAVDVWGLTLQLKFYFEEGQGSEAFGPHQPIATEAMASMLGEVYALAVAVAADDDTLARNAARLQEWARANPLEHGFIARPTATSLLVTLLGGDPQSAFAAVGQMKDTVEDLSVRLNSFAALLPKQARWQMELVGERAMGSEEVIRALADLTAMAELAARSQAILDDIPGTVRMASGGASEMLDSQREAILEAIERQRLETLEFATEQRDVLVASLRQERLETVDVLRAEGVEVLAGVEAISQRTVANAIGELRSLVDYVLVRFAVALALALVLGAAALWLATRPLVRTLQTLAQQG